MSEKPILYYIPGSPPARTVILTAKAIGLELELKYLNLAQDEHKKPEFLKLNPQHTVPTLIDGGKVIWDSHAISTYLIEKYGTTDEHQKLYPKDLYLRARINQRLQFDTAHVFSIDRDIFTHILDNKGYEILPTHIVNANIGYAFLETFLSESSFLIGEQLTVADYSIITSLTQIHGFIPIDPEKYPKLTDYINRMKQLSIVAEINTPWVKDLLEQTSILLAKNKADAQANNIN